GDRHFHRAPGAQGRLLEEQGRTPAGEDLRDLTPPDLGRLEDGGELIGVEVVDVQKMPRHVSTLATMVRASSISSSETSSDGAKRNVVGFTAFTTRPAARQRAAASRAPPAASSAPSRRPRPRTPVTAV